MAKIILVDSYNKNNADSGTYGTIDRLTGGTASASSIYSGSFPASKAVDNNEATYWANFTGSAPHWWKYDCGAGVAWAFSKLRCKPYGSTASPNAFNIQGSNNNSSWTTLYSGNMADSSNWQEFTWVNAITYRYIKINMTSQYSVNYCFVYEFEAFEQSGTYLYSGLTIKSAQSFTGKSGYLKNYKFYLKKVGSPTGNITAKLYSHSGTYGASSVPNAVLDTSTAVDITTLATSFSLITFDFAGTYELIDGIKYCIEFEYSGGDSSNKLEVGLDRTSPTHDGNYSDYVSSWIANRDIGLIFYVYGEEITPYVETAHDILSIAKPIKLITTKEINGAWTASMQITPDDYIASEAYTDIENEEYIIKSLNKIKSKGIYYYDVSLYHNGIAELTDLTIDRFSLTGTVSTLLTYILAGTAWTVGTCNIGETVLLKIDRRSTVLEVLNLLAEKCSGEINFNSKDRTVDLKYEIGSVTNLQLRYDKNCDYIEKKEDSSDLVTRIYPYGPDNYTINTTTLDDCEDENLYTPSGAGTTETSSYKMVGSQGIKINAAALNETFIRDLGAGGVVDLSDHDSLKFWILTETDNASGFTFGIGESAYTENTENTGALTANCWKEVELDLSAVDNGDKNAIRYIGFKNLTNGASEVVFDSIKAYSDNIYIDSVNISNYRINKEYVYNHSAKPEVTTHELMIYPSDDAEVRQGEPNTNFGNLTYLDSRDAIIYDYMSFMKWSLSEIPIGAVVVSATLYLNVYMIGMEGSGIGVNTGVNFCAADWDEDTLTYSNKPAAGDSIGSIDMTTTGEKTLDLTDEVDDWWNEVTDNYGIRLFPGSMIDNARAAWYSKESAVSRPYIKVVYTTLTDPSPVITAAATEYLYEHDEPKLLYKIKVSNLSKVIKDIWEDETINLGDTVRIYDSDLGINVSVRVKKIRRDVLYPENIDIELANKAYSIADLEAKRSKQLSYAMPFEDNPTIVSANAIQEGYLGGDVNL